MKDKEWNLTPLVKIPTTRVRIPKKVREASKFKKWMLSLLMICILSMFIGLTVSVLDAANSGPEMFGALNVAMFLTCMASGIVLLISGILFVLFFDD